ncbi:hypothetical protein Pmani_016451 [Petrolisthes manimaculis]|uniref:Uncharacterized protein n=1 Tax=Petrolisthes manimaculis TaxID=1843537 RepID=A0AAE1PS87_9EUCA|nr:hypothetical protein Pmani_016451 [Petrolisthes manimaculis]
MCDDQDESKSPLSCPANCAHPAIIINPATGERECVCASLPPPPPPPPMSYPPILDMPPIVHYPPKRYGGRKGYHKTYSSSSMYDDYQQMMDQSYRHRSSSSSSLCPRDCSLTAYIDNPEKGCEECVCAMAAVPCV